MIPEEPVFDDLAVTGQVIAPAQGIEHGRVRQNEARLMERADQVLAVARVDPGLAAHRAVDLRQQRGGHLNEAHAPPQDRGGKARKVAYDATAKGYNHIFS